MPAGVHARAPGKLNVYLEVGERQDDGYHDLHTIFQAVSLYQDVWAQDDPSFSVTVEGSVDTSTVPTDARNLAIAAAKLVAERIGHSGGARLHVRKQVPVAGGMGGGSADAAAALVACNALWDARLGAQELHALAAQLGADVPFALLGGTALGTGRGDQLSPIPAKGRFEWVLLPMQGGLSTPAVYAKLDDMRESGADYRPDPAAREGVLSALLAGDASALAEQMRNDLQAVAVALMPKLAGARAHDRHARASLVSGSGPTIAFLVADAAEAEALISGLSDDGYPGALHVHGAVAGARVLNEK